MVDNVLNDSSFVYTVNFDAIFDFIHEHSFDEILNFSKNNISIGNFRKIFISDFFVNLFVKKALTLKFEEKFANNINFSDKDYIRICWLTYEKENSIKAVSEYWLKKHIFNNIEDAKKEAFNEFKNEFFIKFVSNNL